MGGGTGTEQTGRTEEPAVETESSLTGNLEVDLDPEDVWTLGQLIEAGAVSLPPGVAEELMTGYRILQASGYEPPEGSQTQVELRGSGEASGIELPLDDIDGEGSVTARQVVVAEVVEEELEEDADRVEPAVDAGGRSEEAGERRDGRGEVPVQAYAPAGEQTERLATAIERLADEIDGLGEAATSTKTDTRARPAARTRPHGGLALDWALIGLGLGVSTMMVIAAAFVADPVFAILGLALLVMCVFQSVPYLAESADEGGSP